MLMALPYETMTFAPIYLAVKKGFFREEGVNLDYVYVLSGSKPKTVRLALDGEVAFFDGAATGIEAVVRGWGPVKVLCAGYLAPFLMMVRPNIKRATDLRGKRIMAGGGRSLNEVLYLCHLSGWEPGRDITLLKGDQADRIHAFQDPLIDAVAARPQFWHWAERNGFQRLDYQEGQGFYEGGLATTARMLEENPEVVRKVVKAYVRALYYIKDHRKETIEATLENVSYLDYDGAAGNYDILRELWCPSLEPGPVDYMAEVFRVVKGSTRRPSFEDMVALTFLKELTP